MPNPDGTLTPKEQKVVEAYQLTPACTRCARCRRSRRVKSAGDRTTSRRLKRDA